MLLALYSLWSGSESPTSVVALPPGVVTFEAAVAAPAAPIGDPSDILRRLIRELPSRWWSTPAPIRDAILGGFSDVLAQAQTFFFYAKTQMRLATASGFWIDLFSYDYLGLTTVRRATETDAFYAARVKKELVRERVTRAGMIQAIIDLTGMVPVVIEPFMGGDVGGWSTGVGSSATPAPWGWGTGTPLAGAYPGWGSSIPNQVFMTVYRSGIGVGVANVGGWSTGVGSSATPTLMGWSQGAGEWVSEDLIVGAVTDQDIYDTINRTKPVGVTIWVQLV
jgi:hypothetical protein